MDKEDIKNRKNTRFESLNLVSYDLIDNKGKLIGHSVGRTLNISKGGILLEAEAELSAYPLISLTLSLEEDLVTVKGEIVYSKQASELGKFENGIKFLKASEQDYRALVEFIGKVEEHTLNTIESLRTKRRELNNVVLALSKEHKIIVDYVIGYKKIMEQQNAELPSKLDMLFSFMERDVINHFDFEEKVLFSAAIIGKYVEEIQIIIPKLREEHIFFLAEVKYLLKQVKLFGIFNEADMEKFKNRVNLFFENLKRHSRDEIEKVFSFIDANKKNKDTAKKLLEKYHSNK
ncbi:MAG: PilZ domain-containing protein [Desulfobacterales bacterium]|nr:PilZ domain-containing protein [Desulfobacterales bacterium]